MPFACIFDDRVDVWEVGVDEQLFQATPFDHYETAARAALDVGMSVSEKGESECERMVQQLNHVQSHFFLGWNMVLIPSASKICEQGVPEALYATNMPSLLPSGSAGAVEAWTLVKSPCS